MQTLMLPTTSPRDTAPIALLVSSLNHLLNYTLSGCQLSARHAAFLLDRLSNQDDVDEGLRLLCLQMSDRLEDGNMQHQLELAPRVLP
ncbi:hypothetical protein [Sulfuriferula nivalis]|nr:hypothetical protein [Sulfuriferula nivalis]